MQCPGEEQSKETTNEKEKETNDLTEEKRSTKQVSTLEEVRIPEYTSTENTVTEFWTEQLEQVNFYPNRSV